MLHITLLHYLVVPVDLVDNTYRNIQGHYNIYVLSLLLSYEFNLVPIYFL